ncbi:hypothetical protein D9C73_019535 [Collichthys lucidus]|uniref:Uncharacterized protein n=1 Tax=Collichthys lucidus TaxID=240159 RepID=A0A4U5VCI1_COLLU|nr:hypothetical protein D9C73_019535 [Collichthys lucidus]
MTRGIFIPVFSLLLLGIQLLAAHDQNNWFSRLELKAALKSLRPDSQRSLRLLVDKSKRNITKWCVLTESEVCYIAKEMLQTMTCQSWINLQWVKISLAFTVRSAAKITFELTSLWWSDVNFDYLLFDICVCVSTVDPPTSVTLDCHNLVHVVKWNYTEFSPGLQFEIFIGSQHSGTKLNMVDSPNLQTNFSLDTDPADTYGLEVSAVIGPNKSEEAPPKGLQFSYNKNSPASKKCFMDLPAVNVTLTHDGFAQFSFMHPWLLYGDKIPVPKPTKKKRHNARTEVIPEFSYEVVVVSKGTSETFDCNERECEDEILVDPQEEKLCLKISGDMARMAVRGTQEYCAMPATALPAEDDYTYVIYIVVPLVVLIASAFILFLVYKKVTRPSSSLPAAMTFKDHLWRTVVRDRDQVSVPQVEPASPTPLLSSTEFPPATTSIAECEVRERIGVLTDGNGVCDDEEIGNNEACGYTQGGNLDEDDGESKVEPSGYESRPVVD